ncbi:MFS transporter [Actinoplanes flavus]|uniref:MFS transporter n=1 Tax=Actinoplanes flavus TaxID=2820290 RepID=A0ABS3USK0_9ACTN|nr:MFS transporter [Actinoplanes flavus]MBO3741555.1 MFS transporter [Actinoplanes flavus]
MKQFNDLIADFWRDYAALVLLAGGLLGVILLISFGIWAKRTGKPLRPLALAFSMNLALLLNAEGMWVIAIDQLNLPKIFAVLVFAVFEICFLTATSLAAEQYRRTSVHASDGTIVTPGHPGAMLYIAALIAGLSGVIVASNAVTFTEKLLRLAVPCMIFLMWWAALTAAGQRVRRGRFAYSPRRLAERWGWLIPDDDPDLVRMAAERQVRRMVVNYHRVSAGRFPKPWWRSRLLKDARTAGEPVVEEVIEQLARIQRVMDLLVPGAVRIPVPAGGLAAVAAAEPRTPAALLSAGVPADAAGTMAGAAGTKADGPVPAGQADPAVAAPGPAVPSVQPVRFVQPVEPEPVAPAPAAAAPISPAPVSPAPISPAPAEPDAPAPAVAADDRAGVPSAPETPPVPEPALPAAVATVAIPVQRGPADRGVPIPVSPAPASQPAWAATPTGARPAVSIAGSPWWRLEVDRLSKMVDQEISAEDLPEMNYLRINELARKLAPRVPKLGEGVVRTFINEYVRELDGEHVESTYPWRDFLPAPALAPVGSEAWNNALLDLRTALEEELGEGQPLDPEELADLLAPSAPRLDDATIRRFIGDYALALTGMTAPGSSQPWAELLPRPQSARPASDDEVLEMHGAELFEHLRSTGRLSRYKVQAVTGIKSRVQADRIKTIIEERAAETATA